MLDRDDQMSGGKTAAGSKAAQSSGGGARSGSSSGSKSSGGGKMGSGSSQTGGAKSSGGKMGSSSSQTGGAKSSTGGGKMGSKSSQAGANAGAKKDTSGTGLGSKMGASSSQSGGVRGSQGGILSGSRGPSPASRQGAAQAAAAKQTGGILSRGGMVPTPGTHPFRDPARFSFAGSVTGPDSLANALSTAGLSKLANLQSAYGKPMTITSGYRSPAYNKKVGGALKSQHMAHKAVDIGVPTADRAKVAQLAKDMGFTGIGTYAGPFSKNMVHTDLGPARSWGAVATNALRGYQPSEPDMGAIAAQTRTPTFGSPAPSLAAAVTSNFPGRPGLPGPMGFPAEDRQPSTFPGRPEPSQQFNSQIAGRPGAAPDFASAIAGRPSPQPQFNSMVAGRPEQVGMGFPAAFASDFPGRPAPQAGFASQIAARPDPQRGFMSAMAGKPDFPGSLPQGYTTGNFPGRPSPPQDFNSMMAGRPGLPQSFSSQIAGRPETVGPGFPAATPNRPNPGKSYADIPSNGLSAVAEAQANPSGPGILGGLAQAVTPNAPNPGRSFANIPQGGLLAAQDDGSFMSRMMGATGVPAPGNDLRDVQGGQTPLEWTGNEPPQAVAQMQQHVEQVLAQYFATPQTQFPQYASGQWANLPAGSAA